MIYDLLKDPYLWLFVAVMLGIGIAIGNALWRDFRRSQRIRIVHSYAINQGGQP